MSAADAPPLTFVQAERCPICGGGGRPFARGCRDSSPAPVEATVDYLRCTRCSSVWMNPAPAAHAIPHLYPSYYTHGAPADPFAAPRGMRFAWVRHALKNRVLAHGYGYCGYPKPRGTLVDTIAFAMSRAPGLRRWAGRPIRFVPAKPGGRLLDVGCGNGEYLWRMRELDWRVSGVDMDRHAVAAARGIGVDVMHGRIEDLPPAPGTFDAITVSHVLEHVLDPRAVLARLAPMLAPGGILVSITPNSDGAIARFFGRSWLELDPPRHLVFPSRVGYEALCREAGLQCEVFSTSVGAAGVVRESISIARTGRRGAHPDWVVAKIVAYLLLPMMKVLSPGCGEELVCIARRA